MGNLSPSAEVFDDGLNCMAEREFKPASRETSRKALLLVRKPCGDRYHCQVEEIVHLQSMKFKFNAG
jgi:hypothetical protein